MVNYSGDYRVGGRWVISVVNELPNAQITLWSNHNLNGVSSVPNAGAVIGNTDAGGNFSLSDVYGSSEVGIWQENIYVGSNYYGPFNFTVVAANTASATQATASNTTNASSGSGATVAPQAPVAQPLQQVTPVATSDGTTSFLTSDVSMFGYNVPMIGIVAALAVGAFMFMGHSEGRRGR